MPKYHLTKNTFEGPKHRLVDAPEHVEQPKPTRESIISEIEIVKTD